jgi:hypothetical protein
MKPAPTAQALHQDAVALAKDARVLCRSPKNAVAAEAFEKLLQRVLERGDPYESDVIAEAIDRLYEQDDDEAAEWLMEEFEIESELQYIVMGKGGAEKAALLFAIPVILPAFAGDAPIIPHSEHFEELHDILDEASVIDSCAQFRLLPKLFRMDELRNRPYGDFMKLARELGCQVLTPRNRDIQADDTVFPPNTAPVSDTWTGPYAQLRFLVGVAVTTHEGLETVFPPLDEGGGESEDDTEGASEEPEGVPWREPFIEALNAWTGSMLGALDVAAPVGLHEDMRFGMELHREFNCKMLLEAGMANAGLTLEEAAISEVPFSEDGNMVVGITVTLLDPDDNDLEEMLWEVLPHETLDEAIDKLHDLMGSIGFAAADELLSCDTPNASYLLH